MCFGGLCRDCVLPLIPHFGNACVFPRDMADLRGDRRVEDVWAKLYLFYWEMLCLLTTSIDFLHGWLVLATGLGDEAVQPDHHPSSIDAQYHWEVTTCPL